MNIRHTILSLSVLSILGFSSLSLAEDEVTPVVPQSIELEIDAMPTQKIQFTGINSMDLKEPGLILETQERSPLMLKLHAIKRAGGADRGKVKVGFGVISPEGKMGACELELMLEKSGEFVNPNIKHCEAFKFAVITSKEGGRTVVLLKEKE